MKINFNFILASSSPRRLSLLRSLGFKFIIKNPQAEEINDILSKNPERLALDNAILKGLSIKDDVYTLAADTIVYLKKRVIGKPKDRKDALKMLLSLNNNKHKVITAIALSKAGKILDTKIVTTKVKFQNLERYVYENYLETANYKDKAGAYAIQEHGSIFVKEIFGSYTNVIGLPVSETMKLLAKYNILPNI